MLWNAVTRVFPPIVQAIALGVAVVGCFVERKLSSMYTPYTGSVEEQRVERQVEEELGKDPTAVPDLKNFQRQYVLGRNVSPSLQEQNNPASLLLTSPKLLLQLSM